MKLVFLNQPVADLSEAVKFHRDVLGLEEAWREGEDTVSFYLPDRSAQIMLVTDGLPGGPMYLVDDLQAWTDEHPSVTIQVPRMEIPGGAVTGFEGPGGNVFYIFDQPDAQ